MRHTTPTFEEVRNSVVGIDTQVSLLNGAKRAYINFDNAASTPALQKVVTDITDFLPWYSSVHRGTGQKSRVATEAYETAHCDVGRFVGAMPEEHIVIFGKNTTDAINKVARRLNLHKKDVVIVSTLEHHSNDLPWRAQAKVEHIRMAKDGGLDLEHLQQLLDQYGKRVRIVAITGASNVTGYMPDIHRIATMAHAAGAQILVDAAQLAPHRAINMGSLNEPDHLDYVTLSAHKMYAPFGTGALIGRRDTFETGAPDYSGGGTVDFVTKSTVDWAALPDREEAGSPNVVGAVALASAVKELSRIGMPRVARHEAELTAYALQKLKTIPGITIYGDTNESTAGNRTGVITFTLQNVPHALVAAILGYEYGIGVRSGCFCAHPYIAALQKVSAQQVNQLRTEIKAGSKANIPGLVRISFGIYNTKQEIDVLANALANIQKGEHAAYSKDHATGEYTPVTK